MDNGEWTAAMERMRQRVESPEFAESARRRAEEERQRVEDGIRRERMRLLDAAGVPTVPLALVMSGTVSDTKATRALLEPATLTVIAGGAGCGKTIAACAWLCAYTQDRANWNDSAIPPRLLGSLAFVTAARLARWPRYDDAAMSKLMRATRLVVDDMGTEYLDANGAYLSLLDELVSEREANARPLVITTNLDAAAFRERYGERIADRFRGSGRFVGVDAPSLRRKGA